MAKSDPKYLYCNHLLETKITIVESSEPTDIIWENRSVSYGFRLFKKLIVTIAIFFLLSVSFYIIFSLSKHSVNLVKKYQNFECEDTYQGMKDDLGKWQ